MSRILDQALDDERRADCEANDAHIAAGEPLCAHCEQPMQPVIPERLRHHSRNQARAARTVRRALGVFMAGVILGQLVAPTTCPHRRLQLDRSDVHTVPGPAPRHVPQRVEV